MFYQHTNQSIHKALGFHRHCQDKRHGNGTDRIPSIQPSKYVPDTANSPTNRRIPRDMSMCTCHAN